MGSETHYFQTIIKKVPANKGRVRQRKFRTADKQKRGGPARLARDAEQLIRSSAHKYCEGADGCVVSVRVSQQWDACSHRARFFYFSCSLFPSLYFRFTHLSSLVLSLFFFRLSLSNIRSLYRRKYAFIQFLFPQYMLVFDFY